MGFELFEAESKKGYEPRVSIRSNGQIYFNLGAIIRFKLKEHKYAQLFYDKDMRKIGVKPINDESAKGKMNLIVRKDQSSWVSAKTFFDFYQIPLPKEKSTQPDFKYENEMIIINYPGTFI